MIYREYSNNPERSRRVYDPTRLRGPKLDGIVVFHLARVVECLVKS